MKRLSVLFLSLVILLSTVCYAEANLYLESLTGHDITGVEIMDIKQPHVTWYFGEDRFAEFLEIAEDAGIKADAGKEGVIKTYAVSIFTADRVIHISVYGNGIMEIDGEKYSIENLIAFENGLNRILTTQAKNMGIQSPSKSQLVEISDWASPAYEKAIDCELIPQYMMWGYLTDTITREQFCDMITLLVKKQNKQDVLKDKIVFKDTVSENVDFLVQREIIQGKSETNFSPNDFLTREETAAILCRTLEYLGVDLSADKDMYADDAEISDWAKDSVYKAKKFGIMLGTGDNIFSSKDLLSKEQAITTVQRIFENYIK